MSHRYGPVETGVSFYPTVQSSDTLKDKITGSVRTRLIKEIRFGTHYSVGLVTYTLKEATLIEMDRSLLQKDRDEV